MKRKNLWIGMTLALNLATLIFIFYWKEKVLPTKMDDGHDDSFTNHQEDSEGNNHDHDKKQENKGELHHEGPENEVKLSPDQINNAGIEIASVNSGILKTEALFPAEIKLNADNVAHIFPRYSGIVRQVHKNVGDQVKKGDLLAVVESNESLSIYEIHSLIAGTIIARHATIGETIRDDAECFIIADLSTVWIDINIYPKDLPLVQLGSTVQFVIPNSMLKSESKISYIGPVLSEHTRTVLARVVLPNSSGQWRPGAFVTAHIVVNESAVPILVPLNAIQTIGGVTIIFVEVASGVFVARPVEVGRKSYNDAEILSGLKVDDKYVVKGTFILKAELGKSEAGHSHD